MDLLARKFVQCDGIYASKCAIEDLCGVALKHYTSNREPKNADIQRNNQGVFRIFQKIYERLFRSRIKAVALPAVSHRTATPSERSCTSLCEISRAFARFVCLAILNSCNASRAKLQNLQHKIGFCLGFRAFFATHDCTTSFFIP